jgi:hypothetical protein
VNTISTDVYSTAAHSRDSIPLIVILNKGIDGWFFVCLFVCLAKALAKDFRKE